MGRHGGFADRLRVQWTWARPLPDALDPAKTGPLLCGGITVFAPFLSYNVSSTARVGIIGIGGLGHMALQFANKWGCEVHAFTTSDSKEPEARKLGAHFVHNTKRDGVLKKLAGSLDLIISTINVPLDIPGWLETLAPKGRLLVVGAVLEPMQVPAFGLITGSKSVSGSPTGSPGAITTMLEFSARHSIAPIIESFPMSKVNDALEHTGGPHPLDHGAHKISATFADCCHFYFCLTVIHSALFNPLEKRERAVPGTARPPFPFSQGSQLYRRRRSVFKPFALAGLVIK